MKKTIKTLIVAASFLLPVTASFAQQEKTTAPPRWCSDKGYWVVESNIHTPLHHTLHFYTNDDVLVYTESIDGIALNLAKRKIKMKLKSVLESSVTAWEKNKTAAADKNYVAALLK